MKASDSPISPLFADAGKTAGRYGKTIRTLDRWLEDDRLGFPQPVYLGRMRFWRVADLEVWEAEQAERSAEVAA
jgi:hypothetical protein